MADLSAINAHVKIEWVGFRKDGAKGSFWGYFTPVGQPEFPVTYYDRHISRFASTQRFYYKFSGKIGRSITIEKGIFDLKGVDNSLFEELGAKKLNFREITAEKFFRIVGSVPIDEMEMFISYMKMLGEYLPALPPDDDNEF